MIGATMPPPSKRSSVGDAAFFWVLESGRAVGAACAAAGYSRARVYRWRVKDAAFAARWDTAVAIAVDRLEAEADRRARDGVEVAVLRRGRKVGTRRRYSDGLLLAKLKALRPERHRERAPSGPQLPATGGIIVREASAADRLGCLIEEGEIVLAELEPSVQERLDFFCRRGGIRAVSEMGNLPGPSNGTCVPCLACLNRNGRNKPRREDRL